MDLLGSSLRRPRATLETACEFLTDVSAGGGKLLPLRTGAPRREPCALHRTARSGAMDSREAHGPRSVGVLGARQTPRSLLPRPAMNKTSQPEKANPDSLQIETARVQRTFQAGGPPRFRKLPNVGTGQLLPLMGNLSHVPILSHELREVRSVIGAGSHSVHLEEHSSAMCLQPLRKLSRRWSPIGWWGWRPRRGRSGIPGGDGSLF
jgi:hypothetical protein